MTYNVAFEDLPYVFLAELATALRANYITVELHSVCTRHNHNIAGRLRVRWFGISVFGGCRLLIGPSVGSLIRRILGRLIFVGSFILRIFALLVLFVGSLTFLIVLLVDDHGLRSLIISGVSGIVVVFTLFTGIVIFERLFKLARIISELY